jgi:hypothetical protein
MTALLLVPGWARFGGVEVNIPIAWGTGVLGLGLWIWLLVAAMRARRER